MTGRLLFGFGGLKVSPSAGELMVIRRALKTAVAVRRHSRRIKAVPNQFSRAGRNVSQQPA